MAEEMSGLLPPEPPLPFMCQPTGAEPSFIRQADLIDPDRAQEHLVVLAAKAAIGGDDLRGPLDCLHMARRRSSQAAIFWIPDMDLVMRHDPIFGLCEQRIVPKLRLHAHLPAPNGACLRIKNTYDPVRDGRPSPGDEPGLGP